MKAGFYIKIILTITMRRLKKRNLKNKNIPKIAVKRYCLPSSSYPLEVAFLKLAKRIQFTLITVSPVCLFDAEQHVISSSQLNKMI